MVRASTVRDFLVALVALAPVAAVALAAAVPILRLPVLVLVAFGAFIAFRAGGGRQTGSRERGVGLRSPWAWAAPLPIALLLAWGLIPAPLASSAGSDCGSPLSPPAVWRLGEALVVVIAIAALATILRSTRDELGLRRPSTGVLVLSLAGLVVLGPTSVVVGPSLARPFFGEVSLPGATNPWAVLPAMTFAISNGTMEELAYRGALQGWLGRVVGPTSAVLAQGVLFGLQHSVGPEFVASSAPVVAAMVAGGLIAGAAVRRTGSVALPVALHVALDIPLYYYWACRS